eukprot:GHVT01100291.1.p1 GENE.GHVT01100291.1~~GHVT01100291.1.p1  ORF type:complete len:891 (-),score=125.45 GHVT01100291.1:305-2977(-)
MFPKPVNSGCHMDVPAAAASNFEVDKKASDDSEDDPGVSQAPPCGAPPPLANVTVGLLAGLAGVLGRKKCSCRKPEKNPCGSAAVALVQPHTVAAEANVQTASSGSPRFRRRTSLSDSGGCPPLSLPPVQQKNCGSSAGAAAAADGAGGSSSFKAATSVGARPSKVFEAAGSCSRFPATSGCVCGRDYSSWRSCTQRCFAWVFEPNGFSESFALKEVSLVECEVFRLFFPSPGGACRAVAGASGGHVLALCMQHASALLPSARLAASGVALGGLTFNEAVNSGTMLWLLVHPDEHLPWDIREEAILRLLHTQAARLKAERTPPWSPTPRVDRHRTWPLHNIDQDTDKRQSGDPPFSSAAHFPTALESLSHTDNGQQTDLGRCTAATGRIRTSYDEGEATWLYAVKSALEVLGRELSFMTAVSQAHPKCREPWSYRRFLLDCCGQYYEMLSSASPAAGANAVLRSSIYSSFHDIRTAELEAIEDAAGRLAFNYDALAHLHWIAGRVCDWSEEGQEVEARPSEMTSGVDQSDDGGRDRTERRHGEIVVARRPKNFCRSFDRPKLCCDSPQFGSQQKRREERNSDLTSANSDMRLSPGSAGRRRVTPRPTIEKGNQPRLDHWAPDGPVALKVGGRPLIDREAPKQADFSLMALNIPNGRCSSVSPNVAVWGGGGVGAGLPSGVSPEWLPAAAKLRFPEDGHLFGGLSFFSLSDVEATARRLCSSTPQHLGPFDLLVDLLVRRTTRFGGSQCASDSEDDEPTPRSSECVGGPSTNQQVEILMMKEKTFAHSVLACFPIYEAPWQFKRALISAHARFLTRQAPRPLNHRRVFSQLRRLHQAEEEALIEIQDIVQATPKCLRRRAVVEVDRHRSWLLEAREKLGGGQPTTSARARR